MDEPQILRMKIREISSCFCQGVGKNNNFETSPEYSLLFNKGLFSRKTVSPESNLSGFYHSQNHGGHGEYLTPASSSLPVLPERETAEKHL